MAQESNIDLSQITGSGPGGRIVKQDVEEYLSKKVVKKQVAKEIPKEVPPPEKTTQAPPEKQAEKKPAKMGPLPDNPYE